MIVSGADRAINRPWRRQRSIQESESECDPLMRSRQRTTDCLRLTRDDGQKNACRPVRRPAMLLPILHGVDGEPESPGEFRLRTFQFFPQRLDIDVIRHMHNEAIGDFAPNNSASFLGRFDKSRSNLRHDASPSSCTLERYPPKCPSTRSFPPCSGSPSLPWSRQPTKTPAGHCRKRM